MHSTKMKKLKYFFPTYALLTSSSLSSGKISCEVAFSLIDLASTESCLHEHVDDAGLCKANLATFLNKFQRSFAVRVCAPKAAPKRLENVK